jgi:hypothetical protein
MSNYQKVIQFADKLEQVCLEYDLPVCVSYQANSGHFFSDSIGLIKYLGKGVLRANKSCFLIGGVNGLRFFLNDLPPLSSIEHAILDHVLSLTFEQ